MSNLVFWKSLKVNWSSLQIQANNTPFDSELLQRAMQKQINSAKVIRQTYYSNNDFLAYADDDDDDDY